MSRLRHLLGASLLAGAMALGALPPVSAQTLLNVSYDPTREFYKEFNAAFVADWKAKTGKDANVRTSHGGSGAQARAVIEGLKADVVTLALAPDVDAIARTGKIAADWQTRLPQKSAPYTSTIVFLVRKGNPKAIQDWADLAKQGVAVVTPNPKTSGGARWNYLAAWGYGLKAFNGDEAKTADFVGAIYKNAPVLDTGARGATLTFTQRGIGDVLIAWENEAFLAINEFGPDKFEIVVPSLSILAEPSVAIVDANVDAAGSRELANAYLQFLYSATGQKIAAKNYYRPRDTSAADPAYIARFPNLKLLSVDADFGGWPASTAKHFAENGTFDQIYAKAR